MKKLAAAILAVMMILSLAACASQGEPQKQISGAEEAAGSEQATAAEQTTGAEQSLSYTDTEYPLERNGIDLHLDCMKVEGTTPEKNILLIHGVTYSSHEFDIDYEDYSLVRFLAREGYAVWRLDIAGFGQSEEVEDGFLPDSDYAAEDIHAAVEKICKESGQDKIDLFGWSWGTVTTSRFVAAHPEHISRLVLYAPILTGIGEAEVSEPFHHNTWEHAADDFQKKTDGTIDETIADPVIVGLFCSGCWLYDKESSPNGGRRDLCVDKSQSLIDLKKINVPTLVICGGNDPYLNYDRVNAVLEELPEGSALEVIDGASHVAFIEKPYYHDFQERLIQYLNKTEPADTSASAPDKVRALDEIRESGVLRVGTAGVETQPDVDAAHNSLSGASEGRQIFSEVPS